MPESWESLLDCRDFMDRALEAARGLRVRCESPGMARHLQVRLHRARRLDRKASCRAYDPADPQYGKSAYDPLSISLDGKDILITKRKNPDLPEGVVLVEEL
jgi:hypothetical protein